MNEVTKERYYKALLYAASGLSIIILPVIVVWVALNGASTLSWDFLTQPPYRLVQGGIYPQIIGSIYLVALSTLFAAPLGVASAIYLSEYALNNVITQTVRFFTETLAGVPSIVIGLFGLEFLVFELHFKTSLLAGALSLSIMMLPWTIRASEEAIKVVPREFREASLALGATKWQTILRIVIPAALPGIITGVLLGMGRAIGETAIIWLTAGSGSEAFVPASISAPTGSLPMYIFLVATQAATGAQHGYGAALVLIALFLSMSVSALLLRNYFLKKLNGS
jgi:phosphate transport system permease protein